MFVDYVYLSGTTRSLKEHFKSTAAHIVKKFHLSSKDLILDIGSNDGTFLEQFKNLGVKVLGVDPGKKSRFEIGSFLKVHFNKEIVSNVNLESKLDLFSNYTENPEDIDVNWESALIMKINDFMSANLLIHLIYDKDVEFQVLENDIVIGTEDKVQFKEVFGIGLTFKI